VTAHTVVEALRARSATVACAESLTGGLVAAALVSVPGASDVLRGGIVAYATDLKASLLGVDAAELARDGAVAESTARAMATGVAERLEATYGLATTGVAGPGPDGDHPAGTVHVAVAGPDGVTHRRLQLEGDREQVRTQTVSSVLALLADRLAATEGRIAASEAFQPPRGPAGGYRGPDDGPRTSGPRDEREVEA
jgi:nicotinamide-nucleotide amidase